MTGVVIGELCARQIVGGFFHKMSPAALADCVRYTKILLPAQVFFFAGGLMSATLFARGRFAAAAFAPLLYNAGIIAGGVFFGRRLGVESLCWGALGGAILGPFLVPAADAFRRGARFVPRFSFGNRGFIDWLKLTLPLMIGVSLVSADDSIMRYFAGDDQGAITNFNYAKRLVAVPITVAGQAIGQASMPFFTRLFAEGKRAELAATFTRTARAAGVVALLISGAMIGLAAPIIDLLFRRGHFTTAMVPATAVYLAIFAAAVPLWALQGLAARMFYSARNTMTPMVAGTLITIASLPIYKIAYVTWGPTGLAIAWGSASSGTRRRWSRSRRSSCPSCARPPARNCAASARARSSRRWRGRRRGGRRARRRGCRSAGTRSTSRSAPSVARPSRPSSSRSRGRSASARSPGSSIIRSGEHERQRHRRRSASSSSDRRATRRTAARRRRAPTSPRELHHSSPTSSVPPTPMFDE